MLDRVKMALVESYLGAVALGYLLAQVVMRFVDIFTAPLAEWVLRSQFRELGIGKTDVLGRSFDVMLSNVFAFVALALIWCILFRWLYLGRRRDGVDRDASG